ncbi:MAG: helix-turn-helix transcriptional regulator [Pseudonocardia sp.]|nr:helix-turn-helix transcriptional regulator [Pseudonocardia sp.]
MTGPGCGDAAEGLSGAEIEEIRRVFALLRIAAGRARADEAGALADRLVRVVHPGPPGPSPGADSLTARELDVLALAAVGHRNAEIAVRMGISAETVKSYLRTAMGRLGVHSRHAAVGAARAAGRIP